MKNDEIIDIHGYPRIDLTTYDLERDMCNLLPEEIAKKIEGITCLTIDRKTLMVITKDPSQLHIYDTVKYVTKNQFDIVMLRSDPEVIDLAIEYIYRMPDVTKSTPWREWLERKHFTGEKLNVKMLKDGTGQITEEVTGEVVEKVNKIIVEAISVGASDIHLEPFEDHTMVRYRIDGVLIQMDVITDKDMADALTKRIKIMADMDIAMDRVTQGGRISVQISDKYYELRVSIVPVPAGESIVLRLLNKGAFDMDLTTLGFSDRQFKIWKKLISRPYGIILVSGPTGSGKSTTLYASLKELNRPDRKLLTVEDPIEYQMPGIVQVQVNMSPREEEKRLTFGKVLREFLRHDPDVILVGEIRDEETASISVRAALTGHLVISTIHTNDAVNIITRLKDMGVIPYLISSSLIGGVAQRLVRQVCTHCRRPIPVPEDFKEIIEAEKIENPTFYEAVGCEKCHRTGYRGRIGLYEMMVNSDEIKEEIEKGSTTGQIYRVARAEGMKNLLEDGVLKASHGITTPDEVRRVCMMDIKM